MRIMLKKMVSRFQRRCKLRRICKAIGIAPYRWQRDFALGKIDFLSDHNQRAAGKTTAVMLRLLAMTPKEADSFDRVDIVLWADPDWKPNLLERVKWYEREYNKLWSKCLDAGIICPYNPVAYHYYRYHKIKL